MKGKYDIKKSFWVTKNVNLQDLNENKVKLIKRFDIVGFEVPKHKSLIYRTKQTEEQLISAIKIAIQKNANVISIRRVEDEK